MRRLVLNKHEASLAEFFNVSSQATVQMVGASHQTNAVMIESKTAEWREVWSLLARCVRMWAAMGVGRRSARDAAEALEAIGFEPMQGEAA